MYYCQRKKIQFELRYFFFFTFYWGGGGGGGGGGGRVNVIMTFMFSQIVSCVPFG